MNTDRPAYRCGHVAIVGRPNVGKSTLLNRLVGQKVSITSRKPQTTRHRILGIKTTATAQIVYVDTPGLHLRAKRAINRYMNRAAGAAIQEVDTIVFVVEAPQWTREDDNVLKKVREASVPVVLAVNKIDRMRSKPDLLPYLDKLSAHMNFAHVVPLSAKTWNNVAALEDAVLSGLPEADPVFPEDQITDRSVRFMASEIVREKLIRHLGDEIPYRTTVEIGEFSETEALVRIEAVIWVERAGQKTIVIGKAGQVLKTAGSEARRDLEQMLNKKVFLRTWVKIKEGWSDDERLLRRMGYEGT